MNSASVTLLQNITVFRNLSREQCAEISSLFKIRHYEKNQILLSRGDIGLEVHFIASGSVRAHLYSPDGREVSYQDIFAGDMLGELAVIDEQPRSTDIIALEATTSLIINKADYLYLLDSVPGLALATMQKMARMIRFLTDKFYEQGAMGVSQRVRKEVARIATDRGTAEGSTIVVENMPSHEELANRALTRREAVTRELRQLEKQGAVKRSHRQMIILNMDALTEYPQN